MNNGQIPKPIRASGEHSRRKLLLVTVSLISGFVILATLLLIPSESKAPKDSSKIAKVVTALPVSLKEIQEQLATFIKIHLDTDKQRILAIGCDSFGENCLSKSLEGDGPSRIAASTWKIEFYSALYTKTDGAQKQAALKRALELAHYYMRNFREGISLQSFVFANAFNRTKDQEFLKIYLWSLMPLVRSVVRDDLFDTDFIATAHPMISIRYAEQLLQLRRYLLDLPTSLIEGLHYDSELVNKDYADFLKSRPKFFEKAEEVADKILKIADQHKVQAPNQISMVHEPFLMDGSKNYNLNTCWSLLGYTKAWELSANPAYLNYALEIIKDSKLTSNSLRNLNLNFIQYLLPCVESLKILSQKDQITASVFEKFLQELTGVYWDSKTHPLCSASGGFLEFRQVKDLDSSDNNCRDRQLTVADNPWLYSIISDYPNFEFILREEL